MVEGRVRSKEGLGLGSNIALNARPTPHNTLCIMSSDRGFSDTLQLARRAGWGTLAVCSASARSTEEHGFPHAHATLDFEAVQGLGLDML